VLTLADIFEALTGSRPERASLIISEAAVDSRKIIPAAMFVALPGENVDGHNFVGEAFTKGAHLALIQRELSEKYPIIDLRKGTLPEEMTIPAAPFCIRVEDSLKALHTIAAFWRRQMSLKVIGITGRIGKSTTKELVVEVMSQHHPTLKNHRNHHNRIGLPLSILRVGRGYECLVFDVGFDNPGAVSHLCQVVQPQVGIITSIASANFEQTNIRDVIGSGKAELIQSLPIDGTAILNYDDPYIRAVASETHAHVFYYGLNPEADLWADQIEGMGLEGIHFRLHYRHELLYLHVPLIGRQSVHTALCAAAVGLVLGLTWSEIINGLHQGQNQLRMVTAHTAEGALILDDTYNASPESTLAAINLLSEIQGFHIAVLGEMLELGSYEKQGHTMVGVRCAQVCRELIAVGERARITAEAALQAGMPAQKITWLPTVPEATAFLRERKFKRGEVVLVKGSPQLQMDRIVSALEVEV
jgi:UDP-N-acetylmuramoyl-tripeptide--D-alanyl-D-alanine ligase